MDAVDFQLKCDGPFDSLELPLQHCAQKEVALGLGEGGELDALASNNVEFGLPGAGHGW